MNLNIGGVPEHFNLPWHLLLESDKLVTKNIEASWKDFPGGTGAMIEALNNNDVDIAMLLTEGATVGIDKEGDFKIVSFYVSSPLIWGIHVPAESDLNKPEDIQGKRYAISRFGSGSHLMSYVHADTMNWPLEALDFVPVRNLEGARAAFKSKEAEVFLWEKFTTKPYVDNGEFRLVGECPTPFPCFTICVSNKALANKWKEIEYAIDQVQLFAKELSTNPKASELIADRYNLIEDDVKVWLGLTQWTENRLLPESTLNNVIDILLELNLVSKTLKSSDLVADIN